MKININNNIPTFLFGILCGCTISIAVFVFIQNTKMENEQQNDERLNFIYKDSDNSNNNLIDLIQGDSLRQVDDSRFSWDTIKLINGEVLTGSFENGFDDGEYFLRQNDKLFIPMQNVLYYK